MFLVCSMLSEKWKMRPREKERAQWVESTHHRKFPKSFSFPFSFVNLKIFMFPDQDFGGNSELNFSLDLLGFTVENNENIRMK